MSEPTPNATNSRFTLFAVRKGNPSPLLQMDLQWARLMTEIVTPYDSGDMFFVDGAPVKATELDQLKILLNGPEFDRAFAALNWNLKHGDAKSRGMHAKQYPTFVEAMLREHCVDVTSQVISAFRTAVKPRLRDHLPDTKTIFDAGIALLVEGMKAWSK